MPSKVILPPPPKEIFINKRGEESVFDARRNGQKFEKVIDEKRGNDGTEIHPEHGFLTYHKTFKYPEKGWRDDFAVRANWSVKRVFIGWMRFLSCKYLLPAYFALAFLPWRFKIKILERWIEEFLSVADLHLVNFYIKERALTPLPRGLKAILSEFLRGIGVNKDCVLGNGRVGELSEKFGLVFATIIELDVAYRYRIEDLFSETSAELLRKNPRREIKRLIGISASRESGHFGKGVVKRFKSVAFVINLLLLIPRVKRSFVKAIDTVPFEWLQLDEIERDHVKHLHNYNFFGMTIEERAKVWPFEQHLYMELSWKEPK